MDHDVPWPRCAGHRLLVLALPPAGCVALRGVGGVTYPLWASISQCVT